MYFQYTEYSIKPSEMCSCVQMRGGRETHLCWAGEPAVWARHCATAPERHTEQEAWFSWTLFFFMRIDTNVKNPKCFFVFFLYFFVVVVCCWFWLQMKTMFVQNLIELVCWQFVMWLWLRGDAGALLKGGVGHFCQTNYQIYVVIFGVFWHLN